jgi:type II secretory pathway pseudopilin PulG
MLSNNKNQGGVALLIFIILVALAAITYYFSTISSAELRIDQKQKTAQVLKQAKAALIAYALANSYKAGSLGELGKLPCPDYKNDGAGTEGKQDGNCGSAYANGIGYFPWQAMGVNALKDSSGTCLLYAVSPAYKTSPAAALSPDSFGQFDIVDSSGNVILGNSPEDRPVAVIFAPGGTLPGQVRNFDKNNPVCGGDYGNISAYLDNNGLIDNSAISVGNNVIDKLMQESPGSKYAANPVNDRLITISYNDIWKPLNKVLARTNFNNKMTDLTDALAMCLMNYAKDNKANGHSRSLPWPAAMNVNGNEYRNSYSYDDNADASGGYSGRLPYQVLNSNAAIGNTLTQPPTPYAGFMEYSFCSSLTVSSGSTINSTTGEYFNLWSNWKEYFFYALSKSFSPDNSGADCSAGCLNINGTNYAGVVIYSGTKLTALGQQRYSPPFDSSFAKNSVDDKIDISNYLENGRQNIILGNTGVGMYTTTTGSPDNDIMFCIKADMSGVVQC